MMCRSFPLFFVSNIFPLYLFFFEGVWDALVHTMTSWRTHAELFAM